MNKVEILERLRNIMSDLFGINKQLIVMETKQVDIVNWDSLGHLKLFLAIEQNFRVKFSLVEISEVKNLVDIVCLIEKKYKVKNNVK